MPRRTTIRATILAAVCVVVPLAVAQEMGEGTPDVEGLRRHALELTNAARAEAGLAPLALGPALNEAARGHAADMLDRGYYGHVSPDGTTASDRFRAAGGNRWAVSGENIARCTGCAPPPDAARVEAFHAGWMQSPGHRENILGAGFDRMGFAVAGDGDRIYAVQTFAGSGARGAAALDAAGVRAAALEAVNRRRETDGLAPLEADGGLDAMAERIVDVRLADEDMPENVFGLLPEGSVGWTSVSVQSASRGGAGGSLTDDDVTGFVADWAAAGGEPFGGARASHLGFAAAARDDGRATAVAVFGGRD